MRRSQRQREAPGRQRDFDVSAGVVEKNGKPPGHLEVEESNGEEEEDELHLDHVHASAC